MQLENQPFVSPARVVFPLRVLQACEGGERERDAAVGGVLQLHLEHVLAVVSDF